MSAALVIGATRGAHLESSSPVDVAVVDATGRIWAAAGDPHRATYWRSAAKPFQAAACVRSGAADRFGFDDRALALACASHSGEDEHVLLAREMLTRCGCVESDLACGAHPSLSARVYEEHVRRGTTLTRVFSNCSGKHAAMLALARHLGVAVAGYERPTHPVQQAIVQEIATATGVSSSALEFAGDGCGAMTFYLPLVAMARAWARMANDDDDVLVRLRRAMMAHPTSVAGVGRPCTQLMSAAAGRLVVKVGAEGVYCAALPNLGLGIALKVTSGEGRFAAVALAAVLVQLDERLGIGLPHAAWSTLARPGVLDTRGVVVGELASSGGLHFEHAAFDVAGA
jgi:L-asparaginase II